MSSNKTAAILNCTLPRDARVPSDIETLNGLAVLSFCPSKSAERRARVAYISSLIVSSL